MLQLLLTISKNLTSDLSSLEYCTKDTSFFKATFSLDNVTVESDNWKATITSEKECSNVLRHLLMCVQEMQSTRSPSFVQTSYFGLSKRLPEFQYLAKAVPTLGYEKIEDDLYEHVVLCPQPLSTQFSFFNPYAKHPSEYHNLGTHWQFYVLANNPFDSDLTNLNVKLYYIINGLLPNLVGKHWNEPATYKVAVYISPPSIRILKIQKEVKITQLASIVSNSRPRPFQFHLYNRAYFTSCLSPSEGSSYNDFKHHFSSVGRDLRNFDSYLFSAVQSDLSTLSLPRAGYITSYRYHSGHDSSLALSKLLTKDCSNVRLIKTWEERLLAS